MTGITPSGVKFSQASDMHQRGRLAEAITLYQEALSESPSHLGALNQLGIAFFQARRFQEAIGVLQQALKIDPGQAGTRYNLGTMLQSNGRYEEAASEFREAISQSPRDAELYNNLGVALKSLGRYEEAAASYSKALDLRSESAEYRINLASALFLLERYEESLTQSEKALILSPNLAEAELACGRALQALHRYEESLPHIDKALVINPARKDVVFIRSIICLTLEKLSEGWKYFGARFEETASKTVFRPHPAPLWDGNNMKGLLVVWGEQGLGDQVLYASMIPDAAADVSSLIVEVEPRLIDLMERSFPQVQFRSLYDDPRKIEAQAHIPIGGLGKFYRPNTGAFPRQAYLAADKDRAFGLRGVLSTDNKATIGISWRSKNSDFGKRKTADLRDFSPLFLQPGIQLVDLQYGDTADEIESVRTEFSVPITHVDEVDNTNDIDGLAALIEACDVVVTISNTTAHIAGALGKPVWVLIPYHGHGQLWYWSKDRKDNLWYPEARICRQQKGQPWADLIASITPEVTEFLQTKKAGGR